MGQVLCGRVESLAVLRGEPADVTARIGRTRVRARCDAAGHFALELPNAVRWPVTVTAGDLALDVDREMAFDEVVLRGDLVEEPVRAQVPEVPPVVDAEAFAIFRDVAAKAVAAGLLDARLAGWADDAAARLDALEAASLATIGDVDGTRELVGLLAGEAAWDFRALRPDPTAGGLGGGCVVDLRHPSAPVLAGMLLDTRADRWSGRAATFYVRHAEALTRGMESARLVRDGQWDLGTFAEHQNELARAGGPGGTGGSLRDLFPLPFPPRRRPGFRLDLCQLEWLNCASMFTKAPPPPPANPPTIGRVGPDAVCGGQAHQVSLYPPTGGGFGAAPPAGAWIVVGGNAVNVVSWQDTEVRVDVPATVRPGCVDVGWLIDQTQQAERVNEMQAACGRFIGHRPLAAPFRRRTDTHLTVVGKPTVKLTANATPKRVYAEGCRDVTLAWTVDAGFCGGVTDAAVRVDIVDDTGAVVVANAPASGSAVVNTDVLREYRLDAVSTVAGAVCATTQVAVEVDRILRLHLTPAAPSVEVGATIDVTVAVSCPAPAGGIAVTVTSSDPDRLAGMQVTIPQGSSSVVVTLPAGQECGAVTLTATASGHTPARADLTVTDDPHIVEVTPGSATACAPFRLCVTVTCTPPGTTLALEHGGQVVALPAPQRSDTNPADVYAGPSELCVTVPGQDPGDYTVVVQAGSRTARSAAPIPVTVGAPTVGAAAQPPVLQRCVPTPVTITVRATNAVTIEFEGGAIPKQTKTRSFACGVWVETFSFYLSDEETFDVTATGPDGATATTQVTVAAVVQNGAEAVDVRNLYQATTWYVYKRTYSPQPAMDRIGEVAPGDTITVELDDCEAADILMFAQDDPDTARVTNKQSAVFWGVTGGPHQTLDF